MLRWRPHSDYYSLGPGESLLFQHFQTQGLRTDPWPMNHDPTSSGISEGIQREKKKKRLKKKRDEKQIKITRTKNKK